MKRLITFLKIQYCKRQIHKIVDGYTLRKRVVSSLEDFHQIRVYIRFINILKIK